MGITLASYSLSPLVAYKLVHGLSSSRWFKCSPGSRSPAGLCLVLPVHKSNQLIQQRHRDAQQHFCYSSVPDPCFRLQLARQLSIRSELAKMTLAPGPMAAERKISVSLEALTNASIRPDRRLTGWSN